MSQFTVYVTPTAWDELRDLPGHMRQRIRRAIAALADEPRPVESKALAYESPDVKNESSVAGRELQRIRLDHWRIVYAITAADLAIDVLTVRKRPPYDYGNLERLLSDI